MNKININFDTPWLSACDCIVHAHLIMQMTPLCKNKVWPRNTETNVVYKSGYFFTLMWIANQTFNKKMDGDLEEVLNECTSPR